MNSEDPSPMPEVFVGNSLGKNDNKRSSSLSPCVKGLLVGAFSLSLIVVGLLVGLLSNSDGNGGSESNLRSADTEVVVSTPSSLNSTAADIVPPPTDSATMTTSMDGSKVEPATVPEIAAGTPDAAHSSSSDSDLLPVDSTVGFCGANPACAQVHVKVMHDDRSDETSYDLKRLDTPGDNAVLTSYDPGPGIWEHEETLCLEEGQYQFTMYDTGDNGVRGWMGDGYYEVDVYDTMIARGAEWWDLEETTVFDVNTHDRYDQAMAIASGITSREVLEDDDTPQSKALQWIACRDQVSSALFHNANVSSGVLPAQAHGSSLLTGGGDENEVGNSGEMQVLRRYALATFFFATSKEGPWDDTWNFLSENQHECSWHRNVTRANVPFGEFDPAGLVCMHSNGGSSLEIMMDDSEMGFGSMTLNIRVPNNLAGVIPPELGYIAGMTSIMIENQEGLSGPIPSTVSNMATLQTKSILFKDPDEN